MGNMEEVCDQMMMDHNSAKEMDHSSAQNTMLHHKSTSKSSECDMNSDCDICFEQERVGTAGPVFVLKINTSSVLIAENITETAAKSFSKCKSNILKRNSYSPPPLFLANESFLI
jgi:hypothetical protein